MVLAVHGAFDGASAGALRVEMDETAAPRFLVDLTQASEACEFAAGLLASWARQRWREKHVRFQPGSWEQARMLVAHGLELADEDTVAPVGAPKPAVPTAGTLEEDAGALV